MSNGKDHPAPHVEVDDPVAAFKRLEDATRKILAVPKKVVRRAATAEVGTKKNPKGA